MAESGGVFCHSCEHTFSQGTSCPACGSEFVEVLETLEVGLVLCLFTYPTHPTSLLPPLCLASSLPTLYL